MENQETPKKSRFKSISVDSTKYKTHLTPKYNLRKKWDKPNDNLITSFIPGTIIKVFVKEGQQVKKGEKILIFEAMKMKNRVYAMKNGTIKNVNVKVGDLVPRGKVLIELD